MHETTGRFLVSVLYILPLGGISFALFRYSIIRRLGKRTAPTDQSSRNKTNIKRAFAFLAGLLTALLCILSLCFIWLPNFDLPNYFHIFFLLAIAPVALCIPILMGLGKTVQAGAGSATGTINRLLGKSPISGDDGKPLNGKWVRKPDTEINKIKKRIKRSSYNPSMPIGVFIISLLALLSMLGPESQGMMLVVSCSVFAFVFTYLVQIVRGRSLSRSPSFKICNQCQRKDYIGQKNCACGGAFEPPDFYRFEASDEE